MLNFLALDYVNASNLMLTLLRINKEMIYLIKIASLLFMGKYISDFAQIYGSKVVNAKIFKSWMRTQA